MRTRMTGLRRAAAVAAVVLGASAAAGTAWAQSGNTGARAADDEPALVSGMSIITLGGSFDYEHRDSGQSAQMNWTLGYTYMLTDNFALSPGIGTHTEWDDYTSTTTWGELQASPIYYFGSGRLRPYLGGRFGLGFGRDDNPVSVGAGPGFIYLFGSKSRGAGIGAEAVYMLSRVGDETRHSVAVAVGVAFYFK